MDGDTPTPPTPSPAPPQAAGMPPGQPPTGSSPATSPVPNKGHEAKGMAAVGLIVRLMESAIPMVGVSSEVGQELLRSLSKLSKMVPAAPSPGIEQTQMQGVMDQQKQMAPLLAMMRAKQAQGQAPQAAQ